MKILKRLTVGILILVAICLIFPPQGKAETKMDFYLNWSTPYADHIAIFVALRKGYFKEQGLDVAIKNAKGSNACVKVIGARKDDLALGMADTLAILKAVGRGIPIKSISAVYQSNPTAIISLKKNNFNTINDLVGKSLADSPTSMTYYFIKAGLAKSNLDFNQIKFLAVENKAKDAMLMTGKADAIAGTANGQAVNIEAKGHAVNLITMQDLNIQAYGMCIIANDNMLKNKEVIEKFMNAYVKGIQFQRNNPQEASVLFQKEVPLKTLGIVSKKNTMNIKLMESKDALKNGFGHQTKEAWEILQNILYENKVVDQKIDAGKFFTNDFMVPDAKAVFK